MAGFSRSYPDGFSQGGNKNLAITDIASFVSVHEADLDFRYEIDLVFRTPVDFLVPMLAQTP